MLLRRPMTAGSEGGNLPAMRHYGTLIAAVVISPLAWILLAFGQDRSARIFANAHGNGSLTGGQFGWPVVMLIGAGLLLGLIGTLRFSPLGATFAGVVYMGSYALLLIMPKGLMDFAGHELFIAGHGADMAAPIRSGTSMALGAALLVSVISVSRWRRWPRPGMETASSSSSLLPDYNPLGGMPERDTEPDLVGRPDAGGFGTSWAGSLRNRQEGSAW
jgi:hypothetical protein